MPKSERATPKRRGKKRPGKSQRKGFARTGRTDWARLDATTDEDIARDVASNPDAAPEFTDEMFAEAFLVVPGKRTQIALKVDPEVLAFFKEPGPGYQTRMNQVLRAYVDKAKAMRKG